MKLIKMVTCSLFVLLNSILLTCYAHTVKTAEEVFKKWTSWQQIMPDRPLNEIAKEIDDNFLVEFKKQYEKNITLLAPVTPFLKTITRGHIHEYGYHLSTPLDMELKENLVGLFDILQSDVGGFIDVLRKTNFLSPETVVIEERGELSHNTIEKYNSLYQLIFAHSNEIIHQQYLFSLANRFYEYCFSQKTFLEFEKLLLNKASYPITRMLYSVIWLNLAGNGWKHWHEESLKILKARADQGHKMVYIAGGSDLYQLVRSGIYHIKNIDPQLPSQPKYYADDWSFVLQGDINDQIIFNFDNKHIYMVRTGFERPGTTFKVRIATGEVLEIPHSITTWTFFDADHTKLGEYVLERRFCEQSDFVHEPGKTLIMSFNELYFIALPNILNGWNIEPSHFDDDCSIVIKQLRNPVTKQMIVNMRIASLLNATDFKFIALGTCIN